MTKGGIIHLAGQMPQMIETHSRLPDCVLLGLFHFSEVVKTIWLLITPSTNPDSSTLHVSSSKIPCFTFVFFTGSNQRIIRVHLRSELIGGRMDGYFEA